MKIEAINLSDLTAEGPLSAEGHLRYSVLVYESHDGADWKIVHVARKGLSLDDVSVILLTLIADAVYTLTDGDSEDERAEIVARAMSMLDMVFPASDKPAAPDA